MLPLRLVIDTNVIIRRQSSRRASSAPHSFSLSPSLPAFMYPGPFWRNMRRYCHVLSCISAKGFASSYWSSSRITAISSLPLVALKWPATPRYDANLDPVVRTTAAEVRRRLIPVLLQLRAYGQREPYL